MQPRQTMGCTSLPLPFPSPPLPLFHLILLCLVCLLECFAVVVWREREREKHVFERED